VQQKRQKGLAFTELAELSYGVSPSARDSLLARFPDLVALATIEPDGWILDASATSGSPPITSRTTVRLGRGAHRAAILSRRIW
jgi:hypothetical protein